jgi:O-antigen/teichoic acid export membrane protein
LPKSQIQSYFKEFYVYSHPLLIYALFGLVVGILDRWLLQAFSGSVQQGFYGLSFQIGALCFLFTGAMTPLMTREFSIAFGKQDLAQMAALFRRYIPLLYSIAAYFACFMALQADKVTYIMGGTKYHQATIAVAIMSFYPIHQTYGQLSGSVFWATGQTRLYRNIGIAFMLLGLPITFFLIAPVHMMGLNAGATGLAIKMVLLQFVAVNVQLYFNSKLLHLSFWRYFGHQIISVVLLLGTAFTAGAIVNNLSLFEGKTIINFIVTGFLYTLFVLFLILVFPQIFGIKRSDIFFIVKRVISAIRRDVD